VLPRQLSPWPPQWPEADHHLLFWTEGWGLEVGAGTVESEDFRAGLGIVAFWETDVGSRGGADSVGGAWTKVGGAWPTEGGAWPKDGAKKRAL
jgi:hypothetical protein